MTLKHFLKRQNRSKNKIREITVNSRNDVKSACFFLNKFSPNPLIGRIGKDRAPAKQSLLRWPCPLPSDRAIPDLWQNLESKV